MVVGLGGAGRELQGDDLRLVTVVVLVDVLNLTFILASEEYLKER